MQHWYKWEKIIDSNILTWLDRGTSLEISQTITAFSLIFLPDTSLEEMNRFPPAINSTSRIGPRSRMYSCTTLLALMSHNLRLPLDPPERNTLKLSGWNLTTPITWSSLKVCVSTPLSTSNSLEVQSYPEESNDNPCFDHFTSLTGALWWRKARTFFLSSLHTFHT